jgi:nitrogen fixation protein FixH
MTNVVHIAPRAAARPARGRWIPWVFVVGFAVIVAVNATMVTFALRSFPGLADPAAYNHGIRYNAVLAEADRQAALGWQLAAELAPAGDALVVRATRADGTPLEGLTLTGELTRPVDAPASVMVALAPAGAGLYRARVALPRAGQWELHVVATAGTDRLDLRQRLFAQ